MPEDPYTPGIKKEPRILGGPNYDWSKCKCESELRAKVVYVDFRGFDPEQCLGSFKYECNPDCEPCKESYNDSFS